MYTIEWGAEMTENSIKVTSDITPWEGRGVGRVFHQPFLLNLLTHEKECIIACILRSETGWVSASL